MADYPREFEEVWASSDIELKRKLAYIGFARSMKLYQDLLAALVQTKKKEP